MKAYRQGKILVLKNVVHSGNSIDGVYFIPYPALYGDDIVRYEVEDNLLRAYAESHIYEMPIPYNAFVVIRLNEKILGLSQSPVWKLIERLYSCVFCLSRGERK